MIATNDTLTIPARPQPFDLVTASTAVIVVDMQNDFGSEGGMFARAGIDISGIQAVVEPISRVLQAARAAEMPVVYLKMEFDEDLANAGGPDSPNLIRHLGLNVGSIVVAPDGGESRILIRDTWNTEIVSDLTPKPGDIVISKHRYSGFFETTLDATLEQLGITTLVFTGCTTSICVESTLRDAFFRDYRCLVLEDCTAEPIGNDLPRTNHEASLLAIEVLFGWVCDSRALLNAIGRHAAIPAAVLPA